MQTLCEWESYRSSPFMFRCVDGKQCAIRGRRVWAETAIGAGASIRTGVQAVMLSVDPIAVRQEARRTPPSSLEHEVLSPQVNWGHE
jgi:hypothetical protein